MTEPVPLILDVDTGIDDALALAFAVRSPAADLIAVTTSAGNVSVERTTANTLAVLDWLGADAVPVHRGASRPLVRPHKDAVYFHDVNGLGGAELPPSHREVGADRGPAAIVRLASSRPGELTLVCVGPLTNLAIALNVEPGLPNLLRSVVVMGGAYEVPGNVTPFAEFNVHADPEAAAQVFAVPFPRLVALGLDVTHQAALGRSGWEAAAQGGDQDSTVGLVREVCRSHFEQRRRDAFFLHDPLAAAVALDPSLVGTRAATVVVSLDERTLGATAVTEPGPVHVAATVDGPRFLDQFLRILGLPDGQPAPALT